MRSIKVIHCADLHLGAPFSSIPEKAAQRRDEQMQTFERIIDLCNQTKADILLIAGDLFDSSYVPERLAAAVEAGFKKLKNTLVFIAAGNHDPASVDSPYLTRRWPENVGLFTGETTCYELEDMNVRVWGCGFTKNYEIRQMTMDKTVSGDGFINLMVLHGEKTTQARASEYRPIPQSFIENSGMDYIALGHTHTPTEPLRAGKTYYAYSGSPEPLGFDETGVHGVWFVRFSDDGFDCDFVDLSQRTYAVEKVDVSETASQEEIAALIQSFLLKKYGEDWKTGLYQIKLIGLLPVDFVPSPSAIAARLDRDIYYISIEDKTMVRANIELLSREASLRGAFVREILRQKEAFARAKDEAGLRRCAEALNIGLRAFEGEVTLCDN